MAANFGFRVAIMHVSVLSATTGELLWQYTGTPHVACEAIHCAQYFSSLFVRQLLLCDMACSGECADGDVFKAGPLA